MALVALSVIALIVLLLLAVLAGLVRLRLIHLAIFGSPLMILSLHSVSGDWHVAAIAAVGIATLIAGYWATLTLRQKPSALKEPAYADFVKCTPGSSASSLARAGRDAAAVRRIAPATVLFVSFFSAYNFAIAGIPLFSGDVEHARFEYADSGLFGLPSRMYLYGVVVALAVSVAEARRLGVAPSRDLWVRLAFLVLLMTRILSGFKSGLIDVATTVLVVAIIYCGGLEIKKILGKLLIAAAVAAGFVFVIGSTYGSYAHNGLSLTATIEARLTSESVKPVLIVYEADQAGLDDSRKPIQMDLAYFQNRYAKIGKPEPYGFTRLVAARYAGSDPTSDLLIAPVTLSVYAVMYYQFGPYVGLIACLFVGICLAWAESAGTRLVRRPVAFGVVVGTAQMLILLVSRGELVYLVLNWGGTFLALAVVAGLAAWWQRGRGSTDRKGGPGRLRAGVKALSL